MANLPQVEQEVTKEASAFKTWFDNWVPLGNHRWYVWIGVAAIVGFSLAKCGA